MVLCRDGKSPVKSNRVTYLMNRTSNVSRIVIHDKIFYIILFQCYPRFTKAPYLLRPFLASMKNMTIMLAAIPMPATRKRMVAAVSAFSWQMMTVTLVALLPLSP